MCGTCVTVICGQTGRKRIPVPAPAYVNYSQVSIQARVRLQGQLQVSRPIFHSALLYSRPVFHSALDLLSLSHYSRPIFHSTLGLFSLYTGLTITLL
jgi:hypothetical protein